MTSPPGYQMPDVGLPITVVVPTDSQFPTDIENYQCVEMKRIVKSADIP